MSGLYEDTLRRRAENNANPYIPMRSYWHVSTTPHGSVTSVAYNKLGPQEVNLWVFDPTVDNDGRGVLEILKHEHISLTESVLVDSWVLNGWRDLTDGDLASELAEFIGKRDAKKTVEHLRHSSPSAS